MMKALSGGSFGGLKALFSGGLNMSTISQIMASGRKIKQRSKKPPSAANLHCGAGYQTE